MTTTIVTTFDPSKYEQYGKEMLSSLNRWIQDDNIEVVVFYDGDPYDITRFGKCRVLSFNEYCGGASRHFRVKALKAQEGKVVHEPNSEEYENNKEFLYDAARFSYKWFSIIEAYYETDGDYLIWLDADCVANDIITEEFLKSLISSNEMISYLGRERPYTETGFLLFNMDYEHIGEFISWMEKMYHGGYIFNLTYWIDCVAFDYVRVMLEDKYDIENRNLTPGLTGHVWEKSPLSQKLTHNKGLRKVK